MFDEIADVISEACRIADMSEADLLNDNRMDFISRTRSILYLALSQRGYAQKAIAYSMRRHRHNVRRGVMSAKQRCLVDREFAQEVEYLVAWDRTKVRKEVMIMR